MVSHFIVSFAALKFVHWRQNRMVTQGAYYFDSKQTVIAQLIPFVIDTLINHLRHHALFMRIYKQIVSLLFI